ncbi:MAG: NAD(P)H-dependent oxidoreductase [Dehalococcoidia bacterium]|nr:NAD(P)H-dependent oxidoreductase [Dehalococcoidia bacterium]
MNILVLLAHPDTASFNHAIAVTCVDTLRLLGHSVSFHDLCEEEFPPLLPSSEILRDAMLSDTVEAHCAELAAADGIVVVHPNWWGQPPAILKGWVDRVVRPGVAYRFEENDCGEGVPVGLLHARAALVFNTSNTSPERERQVFGDPLEAIWRDCIFGLCGVSNVQRRTFSIIVTSTREQRERWLREVEELVSSQFPEPK